MDLLICNEVLYKDHHEDDLGLGGLRSLPGKPLILTFHLALILVFIWSLIWPFNFVEQLCQSISIFLVGLLP